MYKSKALSIFTLLCFLVLSSSSNAADTPTEETKSEIASEDEAKLLIKENGESEKSEATDEEKETSAPVEAENEVEEEEDEDEEPDCD